MRSPKTRLSYPRPSHGLVASLERRPLHAVGLPRPASSPRHAPPCRGSSPPHAPPSRAIPRGLPRMAVAHRVDWRTLVSLPLRPPPNRGGMREGPGEVWSRCRGVRAAPHVQPVAPRHLSAPSLMRGGRCAAPAVTLAAWRRADRPARSSAARRAAARPPPAPSVHRRPRSRSPAPRSDLTGSQERVAWRPGEEGGAARSCGPRAVWTTSSTQMRCLQSPSERGVPPLAP